MTKPDDASERERPAGGRARLHRALIFLAPLGLALDIFASLWVSYWHVHRSAVVQVEGQWVAGEQLALRTQVQDARRKAIPRTEVEARWVRDGEEVPLRSTLQPVPGATTQGSVEVPPDLALGAGELVVRFSTPPEAGLDPFEERVPIEVVEAREARLGEHSIAANTAQWAADTDAQTEHPKIDLNPFGRLLAGFPNELWVRMTDKEGKPFAGEVQVVLVSGEYAGQTGDLAKPPVIASGPLDELGLFAVNGDLISDVIRVEVRAFESKAAAAAPEGPADPVAPEGLSGPPGSPSVLGAPPPRVSEPEPLAARKFRMVSYAGGVRLVTDPLAARPGETVELQPRAFSSKRPIFVDVHGPDGAWIDALPPMLGGEPDRVLKLAPHLSGLVQLEAYHFTNHPRESTSVARIMVGDLDPKRAASLKTLVGLQRDKLGLTRLDPDWDSERERKWLDHVMEANPSGAAVDHARRFLIGTLPIELHGPPLAVDTRAREQSELEARKQRWFLGLRWFLWGGGGVFLLVLGLSLARDHAEMARGTSEALREEGETDAVAATSIVHRRRTLAARGFVVLLFTGSVLVLTASLMEKLVWVV